MFFKRVNGKCQMKILYVGTIYLGGTCHDRLVAMKDIGLQVTLFDTMPYLNGGFKICRSFRNRTKAGPNISRLNKDLLSMVAKSKDFTHIWFDKATLIWPTTLKKIKQITNVVLIHYTPDPQIVLHRSRHFIKSISVYDVMFTTKPFEMDLYKKLGAKSVNLTYQAYDKHRFYPRTPSPEDILKYGSDVVFVGHYEKYRADCIKAIAQSGVNVKIWGGYWPGYAKWHRWAGNVVMGKSVICEQYSMVLSSAAICLGLLSRFIPETTTTRSFEIPACGAFMLADRTKEHTEFFKEDKEAVFFSSKKELVEKVHYYLEHPEQRKSIADAGRQRCLNSGYSFHDRLNEILKILQ